MVSCKGQIHKQELQNATMQQWRGTKMTYLDFHPQLVAGNQGYLDNKLPEPIWTIPVHSLGDSWSGSPPLGQASCSARGTWWHDLRWGRRWWWTRDPPCAATLNGRRWPAEQAGRRCGCFSSGVQDFGHGWGPKVPWTIKSTRVWKDLATLVWNEPKKQEPYRVYHNHYHCSCSCCVNHCHHCGCFEQSIGIL